MKPAAIVVLVALALFSLGAASLLPLGVAALVFLTAREADPAAMTVIHDISRKPA